MHSLLLLLVYQFRMVYSCHACGPEVDRVTTYTLERTHDDAVLTIDGKVFRGRAMDTVQHGLRLELAADDGTSYVATCKRTKLAVGRADAVMVPDPEASECNSPTVWAPRATTKMTVYQCALPSDDGGDPVIPRVMYLAAGPGIEAVAVNDDCALQGTGFRRIAPDGKLRRIRRR